LLLFTFHDHAEGFVLAGLSCRGEAGLVDHVAAVLGVVVLQPQVVEAGLALVDLGNTPDAGTMSAGALRGSALVSIYCTSWHY